MKKEKITIDEFIRRKQQNQFLREQHRSDVLKMKELHETYEKAVREVATASDLVMSQIIRKYGETIYDDDGTVIGARLEIPAPKPDGSKVMCETYVEYEGLEKHIMYRIGVIYDK